LNSWIAREGGRINVAPLFTFGSPATSGYATVGQEPSRYYAVDGDIVGLRAGSEVLLGYPAGAAGVRYEASTPRLSVPGAISPIPGLSWVARIR
jgi:hypothetical protein